MLMLKPTNPGPVWKFFSSIWLAVGLMLWVGFVCILGTTTGLQEAEVVFFKSRWFAIILGTLMVNLSICTLNRSSKPLWSAKDGFQFPWRLSQIPFLLVHLGLLLVFSAKIITSMYLLDAQMHLSSAPTRTPGMPAHRGNILLKNDKKLDVHALFREDAFDSYTNFPSVIIHLKHGEAGHHAGDVLRGKVISDSGNRMQGNLVIRTKDGDETVERAEIDTITVAEAHAAFLSYLEPSEDLQRRDPRNYTWLFLLPFMAFLGVFLLDSYASRKMATLAFGGIITVLTAAYLLSGKVAAIPIMPSVAWVGLIISLIFLGLTYLAGRYFSDGSAPIVTSFVFCFLAVALFVDMPRFDKDVMAGKFKLTFKKYYPHARPKQFFHNDGDPNPVLRVRLGVRNAWLFHEAQDANFKMQDQKFFESSFFLDKLQVNSIHVPERKDLESYLIEAKKANPRGRVRFYNLQNPKESTEMFDDIPIGKSFSLGGHRITIERFYSGFNVRRRPQKPMPHSQPSDNDVEFFDTNVMNNPVVEYRVQGEKKNRLYFAWSKQFNTLMSRNRKDHPLIGVSYVKPRPVGAPSLSFVRFGDGSYHSLVVEKGRTEVLRPLKIGEMQRVPLAGFAQPIPVEIMEEFSNFRTEVKLVNNTSADHEKWDQFADATYVELSDGTNKAETWLRFSEPAMIRLGEVDLRITYDYQTERLPFDIRLDKFDVETHPGTNQPSEFRSQVRVFDESDGRKSEFEASIYMNHTLDHKGYRFFQSSYQMIPGEPKVSIFSVAKDPGTLPFYAGCIVLCFGVLVIFFVKPSLIKIEKRRARIAAGLPADGPLSKEDIAKAKELAAQRKESRAVANADN